MKQWRSAPHTNQERFDREVLPHLDSGYNLARWLARNDDDASDIVQDACVKAFRNVDQVSTNARIWFLTIVRNTAYTFLAKRSGMPNIGFFDEIDAVEWTGPSPEQAVLLSADRDLVIRFLEELPSEFKEVVILRDLEDLSYKEISEVVDVPIGTVMSRLNRARQRLQQRLADRAPEERKLGL